MARTRIGGRRPIGALGAMAATAILAAATLAAPARADVSVEDLYDPDGVVAIDLTLPQGSIEALEADPDEYAAGTFAAAPTGGTPGTIGAFTEPRPVGIRLKGNATFRGLDGKAAFKVKFNEFGGKKFLGLKRLTLNNMLQDGSMLHEALAYEAFRAAGVAAPRTGYASVRVNGVPYGVYVNVETLDDVWLESRPGGFADPQHLYEGEYGADVVPGGAAAFEVDEGDEEDLSDLEALIAAAGAAEPGFSERMAAVADLEQMTRMWAAERYLGHWDGYSGPYVNNYFLLSDPDGAFQMLPWGTDQALVNWWHPFGGRGGILFGQCLAEEACRTRYREALSAVAASTAALDLPARVAGLAALLAPWQAAEIAAPRAPIGAEQIAAGVAGVLAFLERRPPTLAKWLATGEEPEQPAVPGDGALEDGLPAEHAKAIRRAIAPRLGVDRSRLGRGLLTLRAAAPGPGRLHHRAEIVTRGGRHPACATTHRVRAAGPVAIACALSPRARRHLSARWLRLRVRLTFHSAGGEGASTVRTVLRLPREALS